MKQKIKVTVRKILAAMLCAVMLISVFPTFSFAATELNMGNVTLPAYPGGDISNLMTLDCGYSTQNDGRDGNEYKSYVRIVGGTSQDHFDTYRQSLKNAGYNEISYHETQNGVNTGNKNCFSKFIAADGSHSVYFYRVDHYGNYDGSDSSNPNNHPHYNEARIIVDTNPDTVRAFAYEAQQGGDGKTELYMYGITMADDGLDMYNEASSATQQRRNCGQLIVMKMPDNSLFINDGGGVEQFHDEKSSKAFLDFCREITGVPEGQKMVINTWFITHSHRDHYSGFPTFLSRYSDEFELKNIMYNFENNYGSELHTGSHPFIQKVAQLYPDAKYYNLHTGEIFDIAGVQVQVMLTMEERLKYSTPVDGKYISGNFNDTSAVLMMKFDGKKFLLTGDLGQLDDRLMSMYPSADLKADILQVPHHGFDGNHLKLCQTVAPTYTFFTQNENAINSRLSTNYNTIKNYLGTVYFGGSETVGMAVENGSLSKIYQADVVTTEYNPLIDGIYTIALSANTNAVVDVAGNSAADGTDANIYQSNNSNAQKFIIRRYNETYYTIQCYGTGTFLDAGKQIDGATGKDIHMWNGDLTAPNDYKLWKITRLDNGSYMLSPKSAPTKSLDLDNGDTTNGHDIHLWDTIFAGRTQSWTMIPQTECAAGSYKITSVCDNCTPLAVQDSGTQAGSNVCASLSSSSINWAVTPTDDGYYYIRDVATGLYLNTNGEDKGAYVILGTDAEKWSVFPNKNDNTHTNRNGTWSIVSCKSRLYLDVDNGSSYLGKLPDNIDVHLWDGCGVLSASQAQMWNFTVKNLDTASYNAGNVGYVIAGCSNTAKVSGIQDGKFVDLPITVTKSLTGGGTDTATIPVTVNMLKKDYLSVDTSGKAVYQGLTLSYFNKTLTNDFTLYVLEVGSASVSSKSGSVPLDADASAKVEIPQEDGTFIDCTLTVTLTGTDGDVITLNTPVSVGMLTNADGTPVDTGTEGVKSGLTLKYNGNVVCTDFTLTVTGEGFDYPKYPDEGSVQVDKKGSAVGSFKETGLADIQLSATGIPLTKGTDLIVMLDMSGSMSTNYDITTADGTTISRLDALKIALKDMMAALRENNADVRVAMADFGDLDHFEFPDSVRNSATREEWHNPAYNHLNYVFDNGDMGAHTFGRWWDRKEVVGTHEPTIYTGNHSVDAGAFENLSAHDTAYWNNMVDGLHQGDDYLWETNYDRAMEYIYQLGYAIRQDNIQKAKDRELVVIFMSDGGAWQYNYFSGNSSQGDQTNFTSAWNDWLTGKITNLQYNPVTGIDVVNHTVSAGYSHGTQSPYGYFYNPKGQNWLAEAIKGDPNELYPVVNKYAFRDDGTSPCVVDDVAYDYYYGDIRNHYTGYLDSYYPAGSNERKAYDAHNYDHAYMAAFRGLGAKMYTLGFAFINDGAMSVDVMDTVMTDIASDQSYYYKANSQDQLKAFFNVISNSLVPAATNAYFTDTMGAEYDLWLGDNITGVSHTTGNDTHSGFTPTIKVMDYALDADHNRTGEPTVLETVTVSGNQVFSDKKFDSTGKNHPNILGSDGVIRAEYFYYNTNKWNSVTLTFEGDSRTFVLEPETFLWLVGTVGTTERVLEYQVYLTGSMEGTRPNGVYETNTDAILHYTNYQGNDCHKDTTPPAFPWPNNLAGYRFYLVDENGTPLDKGGNESTFLDSQKLTELVYEDFLQNSAGVTFTASELLEAVGLGNDYELYDPDAVYTVKMGTDGNSWTITKGEGKNATTYVTNYGGSPTTVTQSQNDPNVEYDRTVVWFALKEKVEARADIIVIDYGIPVDISVLQNDKFANGSGTLAGIQKGNTVPSELFTESLQEGYSDKATGEFGTAVIKDGKVRYTLNTENAMMMDKEDVFTYCFQYSNGCYYYATVTVIPATTIYYEDNFVTFRSYDYKTDAEIASTWSVEGVTQDKVQDEDRPGQGLSSFDADNIYGSDSAYNEMVTYSLGSAHKVTVKGITDAKNNVISGEYASAEFSFCGTGFDIISLTSNTTGSIVVELRDANDRFAGFYIVDTYYGYKFVDGNWTVDTDSSDTLYQVPVIKVSGLNYGKYTAKITASYLPIYDHGQDGSTETANRENSYDFYLDAIRIYDPANDGSDNPTVEDAYKADNEGWPEYFELRNLIISKGDFTAETDGINGVIFIDNTAGDAAEPTIEDYRNYGPNNELYLAPGQAIAFGLDVPENVAAIQLAMKTVGNGTAKVRVYDADGDIPEAQALNTATDMYRDITDYKGKTVVISNDNDSTAILSITNVKVTYNSFHTDSIENSFFVSTPTGVRAAVFSLRRLNEMNKEPVDPEPEDPKPDDEKPSPFCPELFDVILSADSVKVGSSVDITVTTDQSVAYVTVNEKTVTDYIDNDTDSVRVWTTTIPADSEGKMSVSVVAYDSEGTASQPVVKEVSVAEKRIGLLERLKNWLLRIIELLFGKLG
ncbi:MAG: RICIN domain-containing protein [Acutalibacteraceae bacterium]